MELDQENSIYSISFCNIVLILYRYENLCIWMYLLVEFSSFSSLQFTTFVFQFTIWKKRSSNLKMSINFGRVLYLKELSYHTQIGRIWKSKTNSLKWDQSGYCSFIRLDFSVSKMNELYGDFLMILIKHISTVFTITWLCLNQNWQNSWSK